MKTSLPPEEIERRSLAIIAQELEALGRSPLPEAEELVVRRVIHTTADFDYCRTLRFVGEGARAGLAALNRGALIVTDTQMAHAGISKPWLARLGGEARCHMSDGDVARAAREGATTRAEAAMDKAARLYGRGERELILAIGNAPTALLRLVVLMKEGLLRPALVIGAPVGFVNVVESKEALLRSGVPAIVAQGRKGGSAVAAAICNALIYQAAGRVL